MKNLALWALSKLACLIEGESDRDGGAAPHPSAMLRDPNWLYRLIFPRFFKRITVDEGALSALSSAAAGSTIVYVAKGMGQLEYNYFNHLFLQRGLPLASYTEALSLRRWMRWRDFWSSLADEAHKSDAARDVGRPSEGTIGRMAAEGRCLLLVIPPSELTDDGLFRAGAARPLMELIEAQKDSTRPISIAPLDFVWSRRPERASRSLVDILFGEKESPGRLRKIVLFWRNYKERAQAVVGPPLDLVQFMGQRPGDDPLGQAVRLKAWLTETLKARRRTITGPAARPRRWFLDAVMGDDALDRRICEIAAERGKPADDLRSLAARYAGEMIADLDYTYIELLDKVFGFAFSRLYDRFHIDEADLRRAKGLYAEGPVVFVPNHKSHMDYLLISYILYHNGMTVPHIAAGINLRFWPAGTIFRRSGAYFIRRAFRENPLYRAVLTAYLKVLLREGYSQEFFIEGARSRTGLLGAPRLGLLSMLHQAAREGGVAGLKFIPVTITYDRVIEQKSYVKELEGGAKEEERAGHIFALTKYLRRQRNRYGSIYVKFGEPISPAPDDAPGSLERVGAVICDEINRHVVATPTAVAAAAILAPGRRGVAMRELKRSQDAICSFLRVSGVTLSERFKADGEAAIEEALAQLSAARIISIHRDSLEPLVSLDESRRVPLSFFRNGIVHFLVTIGLMSRLMIKAGARGLARGEIAAMVHAAGRLLAHEFPAAARGLAAGEVEAAVAFLTERGAVGTMGDRWVIIPDGAWLSDLFASQILPFVDTLSIALRHASERMAGPEEGRQLVVEMMRTGRDLLLLGGVRYRESVTKAAFDHALRALEANGILSSHRSRDGMRRRKFYAPAGDLTAVQKLKDQLAMLA